MIHWDVAASTFLLRSGSARLGQVFRFLHHYYGVTAIGPTVKYHIHTTCLPTGWSSLYKYTAELICLDFYRPSQEHHCQAIMAVTTPLSLPAWEQALSSHPDRAFAQYICQSLRNGFRIDLPIHPPGYALERHDIIC